MPGLTREQIETVDVSGSRRRAGLAGAPRGRAVAGGVGGARPRCSAVRRHRAPARRAGWAGARSAATSPRAALGDRLTKPMITVRGYHLPPWATPSSVVLCASYSGNTEETLACYEAAGALGAMRVVATTGGRLAEAAREDGVPVIPLPAGLQPRAAVAYMLVSALEVATLVRRRAARADRDRRRRVVARAPGRGVGAGRRLGQPREAGRAADQRDVRMRLRRRADRAGRDALEDPDERERQGAGVLRPSCPRPTTTRSSAGTGASALCSFMARVPGGRRPAPARAPARRADRRADRAAGGRARCASRAWARTRSSGCCPWCCWATSYPSTSRSCAASTPRRSSDRAAEGATGARRSHLSRPDPYTSALPGPRPPSRAAWTSLCSTLRAADLST